jgi:hypothetical protein
MVITANGGTDAANIVLFWPDNLPDDADATLKEDPIALVEALCREGKLVRFPCDGDGGYSVGIYVRTPVPEALRSVCIDEERYPRLTVRGPGYFGGMEYMFKHDSGFLKKYPTMCDVVAIPDGDYSATVYRTDVTDDFTNAWLGKHAGVDAVRAARIRDAFAACVVAMIFLAVASFCFLPWHWRLCIAGAAAVLALVTLALSRTEGYRAVKRSRDEFEMEFPSYVVVLS